MELKNINTKAFAGTLLFHIALLVLCLMFGFTPPYPPPQEEGIEVNLGYSDDGMGDVQPDQPNVQETSPSVSDNIESFNEEEIVTQDMEPAPALPKAVNKIKKITPEITETTKPHEVEEPKPTVDRNALYTPKNKTASDGGDQGITGKPGDQGISTGKPDADQYGDQTGWGKHVSFNLAGRRVKQLVKPEVVPNKSGKVIVEIFVDRLGKVTRAIPGAKGSNTTDPTLFRLAEEAAYKCKFDANPNALEEQKGTITFNFILQK